jgi:hypothetical protein
LFIRPYLSLSRLTSKHGLFETVDIASKDIPGYDSACYGHFSHSRHEMRSSLLALHASATKRILMAPPLYLRTQVFFGRDLVSYLVAMNLAQDRTEATDLGKHLCTAGRLRHVHLDHHFRDERLFYRFYEAASADEVPPVSDTSSVSAEPETMGMRDLTTTAEA